MPRTPRRRVSQAEVNRELRSPIWTTASREERRMIAAAMRWLDDVHPYRGE